MFCHYCCRSGCLSSLFDDTNGEFYLILVKIINNCLTKPPKLLRSLLEQFENWSGVGTPTSNNTLPLVATWLVLCLQTNY